MQNDPLILVADDYEDSREMVVELLRVHGCRVASASNGVEALERAQWFQPALVVLDLRLPVLNGWEVVDGLRASPRTQEIPVLVLTGYDDGDVRERARQMPCQGFLLKTCGPAALVAEVRRIVHGN